MSDNVTTGGGAGNVTAEHKSCLNLIKIIHEATTIEDLTTGFYDWVGDKAVSYHHFATIGAFDFKNLSRYYAHNMPQFVLDYFDTHNQNKSYPGIAAVFAKGQFIWMSDLVKHPYVIEAGHDKKGSNFIDAVSDGICMPLYGPNNRTGYMFMGLDKSKAELNPDMPYQVQSVAQMFHVRYCLMIEKVQKDVKLTNREAEVLELITFGKTNPEIAKVLGISVNTVAGYVKQIYLKLDTNDRVSTAMRAQSIQFNS